MNAPTGRSDSIDSGYLYAAVTLLLWAGFVIVSRAGGQSPLTVFDTAALRIATAALVLSPWWLPRLLRPRTRRLRWHQSLLFAALAGIAYPLLAFTGMRLAPASHGAVLVSGMLPLFTALLAFGMIGERPSLGRAGGLSLILIGVATLFAGSIASAAGSSGDTLIGDLCLLSASVVWSLFTVLLKRWKVRAFDVTLGVVAVSALVYLPIYLLWLPKNLAAASPAQAVLQAVYQGIGVVCIALWSYAKAAEQLGATRLVVILSGVPVVGVLMAVALLGEPLSPTTALGAAIVFLGALIGAVAKPPAEARGGARP